MLFVNRISKILKDVGQQKDVRKKVVIVIILHRFRVIVSPNFTSSILILGWAKFGFQSIIEGLDRWELGFREIVTSGHMRIWIDSFSKNLHHRHFHCSLQARLLQLSLSQPAQVSDHPAPTDPELSCTCCCQSSQIQSHHSHFPVSTLAKDN